MQWTLARVMTLIFGLAWLTGCITDLGDEPTIVHFSELRVGQESRYVRLRGFKYAVRASNEFVQLADTLVVRVIGKDSIGFVCEDFLTRRPAQEIAEYDSVHLIYHLVLGQGVVRVVGTSHLFWSWLSGGYKVKLPLARQSGKQFIVSGWKLGGEPFGDDGVGFVRNAVIGGVQYPLANVYYDHFEADAGDPAIPYYCGYVGASYIYSEESGIIRSRWVGRPRLDDGLCWDLIQP